ncbi:hypothetical protein Asulf_02018 [Archaeoglobus sulfaticallidus PM70-1]|uniref:Thioredoxin domain-containing protein n=1 Tax=Archaeoglobus sulfaticallidus PM70-1 TaxID=387631 RepID=N0BG55_9EURY|nr:thioredoxin family protein [Archaeoglobus sulfaticallidus]AGK61983.1 hypothetical protein Asulf_02018 [Archaeoglobus sulfaticallidus PM70-1]
MDKAKIVALAIVVIGIVVVMLTSNSEDKIRWKSYDEALELSKKNNKYVFIYFYSETCPYCKLAEKVLNDEEVAKEIENRFIPVKTDELMRYSHFFKDQQRIGTPSFLILDSNGNAIDLRVGYMDKETFLKFISQYG